VHVGAVETRGANAYEYLSVPGLGVWMILDTQLLVTDGDGAHGLELTL
jgi:hypothetical protein